MVQQSNSATGTSTMVRDALGQVALQSHTAGGASDGAAWNLQDRAGSSVAQTNPTGAVTDVVNYSDFGVPKFTTTAGWAGATGYTGEQTDPTSGLNLYYARAYDPMAGTWLSSDPTSGSLTDPMSQNHYGYAGANPTTNKDLLGYLSIRNLIDTRGAESSFSAVAPKANPFLVPASKTKKGAVVESALKCVIKTASCASKVSATHRSKKAWVKVGTVEAPLTGGLTFGLNYVGPVRVVVKSRASVLLTSLVATGGVGSDSVSREAAATSVVFVPKSTTTLEFDASRTLWDRTNCDPHKGCYFGGACHPFSITISNVESMADGTDIPINTLSGYASNTAPALGFSAVVYIYETKEESKSWPADIYRY